jgi:hypothetical protein
MDMPLQPTWSDTDASPLRTLQTGNAKYRRTAFSALNLRSVMSWSAGQRASNHHHPFVEVDLSFHHNELFGVIDVK